MPSRSIEMRSAVAAFAFLLAGGAQARDLRVCADPNNLPFSDSNRQGFENKIAALVGEELGARIEFVWAPLWRGFVRKTLNAGMCDVLPGVPQELERLRTTRPYYAASYVFLQRADVRPVASFDDPALKTFKIGVQLVGDDGANTPPMDALAKRSLVGNVRGFMVIGDWSKPNPLEPIVDAVSHGDIDLALVWGPVAGYYAQRVEPALRVTPIPPETSGHLAFAISMGVRKGDTALAAELDAALERRRRDIDAILDAYGVPRIEVTSTPAEVSP